MKVLLWLLFFCSAPAFASGYLASEPSNLGLIWIIPFAGLLLSIAIFPLIAPRFWHHHFGKVALFWALVFLGPYAMQYGPAQAAHDVAHTVLLEYIPFIVLLLALYTVTGGIYIRGNLHGTPLLNTGLLATGTALASFMGTTGAAMLLIRPLIRANDNRRHNKHVIIFFIFLVGNVGGALTPLGDPPLFLGFLKGIDFFWPMKMMLMPMLLLSGILLALFYALDYYYYHHGQEERPIFMDPTVDRPLHMEGGANFLLLGGIVASVLLSGLWKPGILFQIMGTAVELQNIVRDLLLLGIANLSWLLTPRTIRTGNAYTWAPMLEVAKLFAAIFVTILPVIAILRMGQDGALAPLVSLVNNAQGQPDNVMYFWLTGILSSFLDNAPTYLVFFNVAGGDPAQLMGPLATTLLAISAGAVFMGANTYLGNAPNFMIKAIAEERGIKMPGFFGYMLWSGVILMPCFVVLTLIFFQ